MSVAGSRVGSARAEAFAVPVDHGRGGEIDVTRGRVGLGVLSWLVHQGTVLSRVIARDSLIDWGAAGSIDLSPRLKSLPDPCRP